MNSKLRKLVISIVSVIFLIGTSMSAFATETDNTVSLNAADYSTLDALEKSVAKYLSDPNIDEVMVLTEDNYDDCYIPSNPENISGDSPLTTSPVYYQVKNVVSKSNTTGSSDLAIATGQPGITVSITKTKSVSTTLSATFGATYSAISGAVGWNVTGSTSISISGSAKVPSKYNGKSVKTMTLHAKPVYKVKSFDVYKYVPGYINTKLGTGTTKKAYGVSFTKTYVYK